MVHLHTLWRERLNWLGAQHVLPRCREQASEQNQKTGAQGRAFFEELPAFHERTSLVPDSLVFCHRKQENLFVALYDTSFLTYTKPPRTQRDGHFFGGLRKKPFVRFVSLCESRPAGLVAVIHVSFSLNVYAKARRFCLNWLWDSWQRSTPEPG